jgi:hypothetical protein
MQKQQQRVSSTYYVTMDDDKLGIKPEVLVGMYSVIDSKARQLAPEEIRRELAISQDGRVKTKFYVAVSGRMAPYFIAAIQQQVDSEYGVGLRSYFHKLQEQIMSQMFA